MTRRLAPLALAAVVLAGCGSWTSTTAPSDDPTVEYTPAPPPTVIYDVTGTATEGQITYQTPTGQSQDTISIPLTNRAGSSGFRYTTFGPGDFLYISVQNQDEFGTVTCKITVGDQVISENSSSGEYGIATCEGERPG